MDRAKSGIAPVSYSEMLRLLGGYVDRAHLTEIRIVETDEGFILQGLVMEGAQAGERATYQLTSEDIQMLLDNALAQRSKKVGTK